MENLNFFILNIHQVFYALLAVWFCFLFATDLGEIKSQADMKKRRYYVLLFGTLFLGLAATFYEPWKGMGMFFSVEFAFFITIGLVSPKYAASFFIFLLLTRPWETFGNQLMETMPRDIFYVALISLLGHKIANKQFYLRINLGSILAGMLAVWTFVSGFFGNTQVYSIQYYVDVFSKAIIIFFLVQNCFEKPKDLLAAKGAVVLAILEMGIISARNTFMLNSGNLEQDHFQRLEAVGILANSNDIAAVLILALPFCVFFFLKKPARTFLWPFSLASFGIIGALVWNSQSRGALLAIIAAICGYFLTRINSRKTLLFLGVAGIAAALVSFSLLKRKSGDLEGSTSNRIIYWKAGVNMAARNPLFGVGFAGFNENFAGYAVGGKVGSEGKKMTAHSSWVQVLAENGFFGLFLFAGLWLYGFWRGWLLRTTDPEYFASLCGYGMAATFLSHGYTMYPYILISLTITHSFLETEANNRALLEKIALRRNLA